MTREQLEHAIRAACDVSGDSDVWVFGSQAILGQYPDAPEGLRQSAEADVAPRNFPERCDRIDGALGELSSFHATYGFYVHGLPIESAILPSGWQDRAVAVDGHGSKPATGWCLEGHDLALAKLVAFREKDRAFVRTLIIRELVEIGTLVARLGDLPVGDDVKERLREWLLAVGEGRPRDR